jgi:excisionase family DNA binding protein
VKNRTAKRTKQCLAQVNSESIPVSEAARLLGVSQRTVKRMCSAGQLASFKTAGGHVRVPRPDVERFRQGHVSAAPAPASSVLNNRRERVEELGLEAQELRAKREIEKLREEDTQTVRARTMAVRADTLAQRRGLEETRLQRERDGERREREKREATAKRERDEFSRGWLRWAQNVLPDWLSAEQEHAVVSAVETTLSNYEPREPDEHVRPGLERTIERFVSPWRVEREERARRERLIEQTVWRLPTGATERDKARAVASARTALSTVTMHASDAEVRVVLNEAIAPVIESIEEAQTRARREHLIESAARSLPFWNSTDADKAQVQAEVRSAVANLPLRASQREEQTVVDVAVASVRRAIEERTNVQRQQSERERKKSTLITLAVFHAGNYLDEEFEIEDDQDSFELRRDVGAAVRSTLEEELTGTESQDEANRIAREIVDDRFE